MKQVFLMNYNTMQMGPCSPVQSTPRGEDFFQMEENACFEKVIF